MSKDNVLLPGMPAPKALLERLVAIGRSLQESGHALALIGLGSVGLETQRLDIYSDLDFFAIVEEGYKLDYIEDLGWLHSLCPVVYHFRNSPDGYKLLFQDGIFCEFAVFERSELAIIPFSHGRIIWKRPEIDDAIAISQVASPATGQADVDWLLGEALTNLYIGLGRFRRGEKLSAARFIQHYAVDRLLELAKLLEDQAGGQEDVFAHERRFEQRFPGVAAGLPQFVQGYEHSVASARAILEFLERHFAVNPAMAAAIRRLCI